MFTRRSFCRVCASVAAVPATLGRAEGLSAREPTFREPGRALSVHGGYDLIVAGGGPAGIAAAITAARAGRKVALLEQQGALGGIWTSGLLGCMLDFDQCPLTTEITARLDALGARHERDAATYTYEPEYMKLVLDRMCAEAGVEVHLHVTLVAAYREATGPRIAAVVTESKSGREAWTAKAYADCTGDGDLAARAGCGFDVGDTDGSDQPASLCAILAVRDAKALEPYAVYRTPWAEATAAFAAELKRAGVRASYGHPTLYVLHPHLMLMMANHEYAAKLDDAASVARATAQAREENFRIVSALARLGGPWRDVRLVATAERLGLRTARRIHGRATVTKDDLIRGATYPDGVCTAHFAVDIHRADDGVSPIDNRGVRTKPYQIPLGALRARDVENLWMAGRCLSGDFVSHASYRVTGVAVATGAAVGRAACAETQAG